MTLFHLTHVGLGGFFGAITRFSITQIMKKLNLQFPLATLTVNLLGSFILGFIIGSNLNETLTLLIGTGFLGAFTTFSTFKLDSIQLMKNKKKGLFSIYTIISYVGGISLALIGILTGQFLL